MVVILNATIASLHPPTVEPYPSADGQEPEEHGNNSKTSV